MKQSKLKNNCARLIRIYVPYFCCFMTRNSITLRVTFGKYEAHVVVSRVLSRKIVNLNSRSKINQGSRTRARPRLVLDLYIRFQPFSMTVGPLAMMA